MSDVQKRRAERKAAAEVARAEQYEKDLEKLNELEEQLGDGRVVELRLPAHVPGLPTIVVVKTPSALAFKRFRDQARAKASRPGEALDLLADTCVAFPDAETYKRVCEAFPGTHDCVGQAAVKLAEAQSGDEGKG